jgi:hypothetical protein
MRDFARLRPRSLCGLAFSLNTVAGMQAGADRGLVAIGRKPDNAIAPAPRFRARRHAAEKWIMSNGSGLSLEEIEARMAIVRDNIRELIEQAAAYSGAEDEERNAERIAQQNAELDRLTRERDALAKLAKK